MVNSLCLPIRRQVSLRSPNLRRKPFRTERVTLIPFLAFSHIFYFDWFCGGGDGIQGREQAL